MGAVSGYVQRRNKKKFKELYSPPPSFLLSYLVTGDETGRKEDQRVYVGGKRICKAAKASYKQRRSKKKIRFRDLYYLNTPPPVHPYGSLAVFTLSLETECRTY